MRQQLERRPRLTFWMILGTLGLLWILSTLISAMFGLGGTADGSYTPPGTNVVIIPIHGIIQAEEATDIFGNSQVASSDTIVKQIKRASSNPAIKGIIFEINSPGGSPVASDEIGAAIKKAGLNNVTTVAVIREMGTSGGYWIASATDHVIANRMSITGSIGVIGSFLEFSDLLTRYNISYKRFVGGRYKDIGSPFKNMTQEEEVLYQAIIDRLHEYFIEEVATNRNLSINETRAIATGMFFIGSEAKEMGLVDELGSMDDAIAYMERTLNTTVRTTEYSERKSFLDLLTQMSASDAVSYQIGRYINPGRQNFIVTA